MGQGGQGLGREGRLTVLPLSWFPGWRRTALALAVVLGLTSAAAAGWTHFDSWQRETIFRIDPEQLRWYSDAPRGTEVFDLELSNGDRVRAWYLPAASVPTAGDPAMLIKRSPAWRPAVAAGDPAAGIAAAAAPAVRPPTVLYLHGARWNLHNSVFRLRRWHELGFNMLAIDYRGFGESTPMLPSEDSAFEDVLAAFEELRRREPDPSRRFIYGHSLDGALALRLGAAEQTDPVELAGIVVESTFTSIAELAAQMRWGWLPGLRFLITQPFDSKRHIAAVDEPILLIHGSADRLVPHEMSERLHDAASAVRGGVKSLLIVDGASHSGVSRAGGERYERAVGEFVRAASAEAAGALAPAGRRAGG